MSDEKREMVDHPAHYGGDTMYEAIKVIEAWGLGFCLGNAVKYICRAEKKDNALQNLEKARWYLDREIARRKGEQSASRSLGRCDNDCDACKTESCPEIRVVKGVQFCAGCWARYSSLTSVVDQACVVENVRQGWRWCP